MGELNLGVWWWLDVCSGGSSPGVLGGAEGLGEVGTILGNDWTGPYGICTVRVFGVLLLTKGGPFLKFY